MLSLYLLHAEMISLITSFFIFNGPIVEFRYFGKAFPVFILYEEEIKKVSQVPVVVPPALYAEMSYAAAPENDEVVRLLGQILKIFLLQDLFNTLHYSFTARGQFLSPRLDFSGKL